MPSLADTQRLVRRAIVTGEATDIEPLLVGGRHVAKRLAIHHRHYESSLVTALVGKFPATVWLVGTAFVAEAAQHFVREHPPAAPCIAEYGEEFPRFLSIRPEADRVPYLRPFATLEWHLGHAAVAIDRLAITWEEIAHTNPDALPETRLALQRGLRYVQASWPVDDLMKLYLTNTAPEQLSLDIVDVWLEIRGARGEFAINRLEAGDFAFRSSIAAGLTIGEAAEAALAIRASFDPGRALASLVVDGAATGISVEAQEEQSC